jgi:hypothetical protein
MVEVDGPMPMWPDQVFRHVRTERHRMWSARLEVDMATTILQVPIKRIGWGARSWSAAARPSSAAPSSASASTSDTESA